MTSLAIFLTQGWLSLLVRLGVLCVIIYATIALSRSVSRTITFDYPTWNASSMWYQFSSRMMEIRPQLSMAAFILVPATIVGSALYHQQLPDYKYEFQNVRVEKLSDWSYYLQPAGQRRFYTTVCQDYAAPDLATGMTLRDVIFIDEGTCWSLDPNKHAGYFILRSSDGKPEISTSQAD